MYMATIYNADAGISLCFLIYWQLPWHLAVKPQKREYKVALHLQSLWHTLILPFPWFHRGKNHLLLSSWHFHLQADLSVLVTSSAVEWQHTSTNYKESQAAWVLQGGCRWPAWGRNEGLEQPWTLCPSCSLQMAKLLVSNCWQCCESCTPWYIFLNLRYAMLILTSAEDKKPFPREREQLILPLCSGRFYFTFLWCISVVRERSSCRWTKG